MDLKWHEIEPGTYEARVGDWLLEVGRHDDGLPWTVWVGLLNEKAARGTSPMCGTTYRRNVIGTLDEAQRAAIALAVEKCAPFVATARAEAALAERDACAQVAKDHAERLWHRGSWSGERDGALAVESAIRARTTPAALSTDTLAAIAEARGLRLVEPEHLAELEALRAAVDEETALDRERSEHGCGDASCVVERAAGMTTNGGCRCGRRALRAALQKARKQIAELEALRDVPVLRWREMRRDRHLGTLGDWSLDAYETEVVVLYRNTLDLGNARASSLDDAKVKGVAKLRAMGVVFRVEDDEPSHGTIYQGTGSRTSGGKDGAACEWCGFGGKDGAK